MEAANAERAPCAILHPHGIRALPPPQLTPCGGGWDAATTPTLRNHLYLVDVTTYHPLRGSGGGGGGGDGDGGGGGGGGCGETIVEVAEGEAGETKTAATTEEKNNEMNIGTESRNYYTSAEDGGGRGRRLG